MNFTPHWEEILKSRLDRSDEKPVLRQLEQQRKESQFRFERIPLEESPHWKFDDQGVLRHQSGRFFSVEGIEVTDPVKGTTHRQPIINQPEHGILGILLVREEDRWKVLLNPKIEPGNYLDVQISPTVQATVSNYQKAHRGSSVPFISYFTDEENLWYKKLQSEHGYKFLGKANYNILTPAEPTSEEREKGFLLSLGQYRRLQKQDHAVNMDARSIMSCLAYSEENISPKEWQERTGDASFSEPMEGELLYSFFTEENPWIHTEDLLALMKTRKANSRLQRKTLPLKELYSSGWEKGRDSISSDSYRDFNLIMLRITAPGREVTSWTQPIVEDLHPKKNGLLVKQINGVFHFCVKLVEEVCSFQGPELAPVLHNHSLVNPQRDPFARFFDNPPAGRVLHRSKQSEEGGRFFHFINSYEVVYCDEDLQLPADYFWLTGKQLKRILQKECYVNVELRTLISLIM